MFLAGLGLSGCGIGLCVGAANDGGCRLGAQSPRLLLSGIDGLSIRKNDCYPVTLSALDAAGNPMTDVTATVMISASSGVVLYSSLAGCQTYDSAYERTVYTLTPQAPQALFYFRCDVEGAVTLNASTSADTGLSEASQPLSVVYSAFDGSKGPNANVTAVIQDNSGKTFVGGGFQTYDDFGVRFVARLNSDGSLDTGFLPTGTGLSHEVLALAAQGDGKLYAGGAFTSYNGTSARRLARLNTDGSLDASFTQAGTGLSNRVYALAIQGDGKLLAGGDFTTYNGTSRGRVARLSSDGSLDTDFALVGTGFNSTVLVLALQIDGKVLVGGGFSSYNGTSRTSVARLHSDGTLDTTFTLAGTGLNNDVYALALQSDGKAIIGGDFTAYNGTPRPYLARLNVDGSLDAGFTAVGTGLNLGARAVALQTDGKLVVGGVFSTYDLAPRGKVARLNADGSLDSTFAPVGTGFDSEVGAVALRSDGRVFVGGYFGFYNGISVPYLAVVCPDGSLDPTSAPSSTGLNGSVSAVATQADGKTVVAGQFSSYSGTSRVYVARLNRDGTLDNAFATTGSGFSNYVYALGLQGDGRAIVGGDFTTYNGTSRPFVARLGTDGSLDATFVQTGTGLSGTVHAMAIAIDGKSVVGGDFTSYNGVPRPYIARLNSDGSLDTGFAPTGTGLNNRVYAVALQGDGKVIAGGNLTSYNGTSRGRIARLNSDGSLDTSFAPAGTSFDSTVQTIAIQSDGKLVVGGYFTSYNGSPRMYVARLNSDGTLDNGFSLVGTGFNDWVYTIKVQTDGRIIVGGDFTADNGTNRPYIARLNADGSLDTTFGAAGTGLNFYVQDVVIQSDNKIVVGGLFTAFNTSTGNYLARLTYIGTLD